MRTLFYTHPAFDGHETPPGHPEQVARLHAISASLKDPKFDQLIRRDAPMGTKAHVLLAHPEAYFDRIEKSLPKAGGHALDGDTYLAPGSLEAALRAVGSAIDAIDQLEKGDCDNAFIAARPPGHHAEISTAMGFCLFGTVAIAAKYALTKSGINRVAIVDFDVHHGNGTEDLIAHDENILFISSHQMPLYPGTGLPSYTGPHDTIMNLALPPHSNGADMKELYQNQVFPRIDQFEPDLILISAGFDAHQSDPLAQLNWVASDYHWLTEKLMRLARKHCNDRILSSLEGGYDLKALGECVAVHVNTLMEERDVR